MFSSHLSNRLEQLFQIALDAILQKNLGSRLLILVPSRLIGAWLELQLIENIPSGTCGLEITSAQDGFKKIFRQKNPLEKRPYLSDVEALLALSNSHEGDHAYFKESLSLLIYSRYMLGKRPKVLQERAVFSDYIQNGNLLEDNSYSKIILFGWSSICPLYLDTLKRIGEIEDIEVLVLLFSPCMLFWSDVLSRHEEAYLLRRLERLNISLPIRSRLEELLADKHPFLANTGTLSRHLLNKLENDDIVFEEHYVLHKNILKTSPYSEFIREEALLSTHCYTQELNLLERLKTDMLLLVSETSDGVVPDDSLQIFTAPTRYHEVIGIKDKILDLFKGDEILPGQVVIAAPDISLYKGAIGRVFGVQHPTIPYQIIEDWNWQKDIHVKQLYKLLRIGYERFDLEAIQELLEAPLVASCLEISNEEKDSLLRFLKEAPFSWGISPEHKQQVLRSEGFSCVNETSGTLEEVLFGLYKKHQVSKERDLLAKIHAYLEKIYLFFNVLYTKSDEHCTTYKDWLSGLIYIVHSCFNDSTRKQSNQKNKHEIPSAPFELFVRLIDELEVSQEFLDIPITFKRFCSIVEHTLAYGGLYSHKARIWAPVVFCSLQGGIPPAEVVCVLGQELGAFPDADVSTFFYYLDQYVHETHIDYSLLGRKAFLEAIFAAKRAFVMSYRNYSFERRALISPSLLIEELKEALTRRYGLEILSPQNEQRTISIENSVEFNDLPVGTTHRAVNRSTWSSLDVANKEIDVQIPGQGKCGGIVDISILDLLRFSKDPVQEWVKSRFGEFSKWESDGDTLLPRAAINQEVRGRIEQSSRLKKRSYHEGFISEVFDIEVEHLESQILQNIGTLHHDHEVISISLTSACKEPLIEEKTLYIPAVLHHEKMMRLHGDVVSLFRKSHLLFTKNILPEFVRKWPEILVRLYANQEAVSICDTPFFEPIATQVLSGEKIQLAEDNPCESLKLWLLTYSEANKSLIPITSKIVEKTLNDSIDKDQFMKLMKHEIEHAKRSFSPSALEVIMDEALGINIDEFNDRIHMLYRGMPKELL